MSTILVWKEQLQELYVKYAVYVDKVLKLILGLAVFGVINSNIGYMKIASSMLCTIGLSVVCAFLPMVVMVLAATALILAHLYSLSLAVAGVAGAIFIVMYIFYFRFTPKKAWLILLTPLAFVFKVPYLMPLALGLTGAPISLVPLACGTIVYYMLHYVHTSSAALSDGGAEGLITTLTTFAKHALVNKEMWLMIAAFVITLLVVYGIRKSSSDYAWKIAIVTGTILDIVMIVVGSIALKIDISYLGVIIGSVVAAGVGCVLEILFFSVNYARTERTQFEDDEYYYYVKAVPKLTVTAPKKRVKTINEHKETTVIDTENIKKVAHKQSVPAAKKQVNADTVLLKKNLEKDIAKRSR